MRRPYRTIGDVLRSPWAGLIPKEETPPQQNDRVLHSTKLEDRIYADLRNGDPAMDALEQAAGEKLRSFPALARDTYQSFYSLLPHRIEDGKLSAAARKFNGPILENMLQSEDYPTLKSICEGRELPAYEAGRRAPSIRWKGWRPLRKRPRKSLPHSWSGCARAAGRMMFWNRLSLPRPIPPRASRGKWRR